MMRKRDRDVVLLLFALALMPASAPATGAAIYKCFDNRLGLVYTDLPCKDGEKLEIRAGEADPDAVARLDRIRDQLDQSAAQRISDERRAAAQRAYADQLRQEAEERTPPAYAGAYEPYFDYGYVAYPPFAERHPPREKPRKADRARGSAPSPPYIVPRP
jgi:hypothetical protein